MTLAYVIGVTTTIKEKENNGQIVFVVSARSNSHRRYSKLKKI